MKTIVGVKFKKPGKMYYFDPQDLQLEPGTKVIVETALGDEYGEIIVGNKEIKEDLYNEKYNLYERMYNNLSDYTKGYLDAITYVWQYNSESITRKNNYAYNYLALDEYNKNISLVVSKTLELNISDDKIAAVLFFGMLEMYYMYLNASSKTVKKIIESSRENAINFKKYQKVLDAQQVVSKFVNDRNTARFLIPDISFEQFINEVISNA